VDAHDTDSGFVVTGTSTGIGAATAKHLAVLDPSPPA
jgi:short-subunit dehydrogenase